MMKGIPSRPDRPQPGSLFVGRAPQDVINDLYTNDLKTIMVENWEIFSPLFNNEKARLEMNMDTMNVARRVDAHTKPVSSEEAENFMNSYHWISSKLSKLPV
jgi:hypothetical protein